MASEPAQARAAAEREQARAAVVEQEVAEEQAVRGLELEAAGDWEPVAPGLELAVAAREQARVAVEEQALAQEELVAVAVGERELAVG